MSLVSDSSQFGKSVSIIIPVYNEAENIPIIIQQIYATFPFSHNTFEIIIIDDHSSDETPVLIHKLKNTFAIHYFLKKGRKGKAQSLLEGFSYAKNEILVMIDGDLQYPVSVIPSMIEKITNGADIVIAKRAYQDGNVMRHITSTSFSFVFGNLLHQFSYDIQSGLKVFKKDVLERFQLSPSSSWMFDLEFLIKARNAGFRIDEVMTPFYERKYGKSKIKLYTASREMALEACKLKFHDSGVLPFTQEIIEKWGKGFHFKGKPYIFHSSLQLRKCAFHRFTLNQKIVFLFTAGLLAFFALVNIHVFLVYMISFITLFYFADLLFLFYLVNIVILTNPSLVVSRRKIRTLNNADLPLYTILCPLYKEWMVIPQFLSSMKRLDYPKDKLQVLLLLEEDDKASIAEVNNMQLPDYFEVCIVPDSYPKTKPKALNYGLSFTRGEYLVIYDAEDIPQKDQLKKALIAFRKNPGKTFCVQAKLNFYNTSQNLLTKFFSLEYTLWFDLVLPGLQAIHAPLPLGGTSNHFKTSIIKDLEGWDAFNVTEDADLGIRLFKQGFRTVIIDSVTYEEATSKLSNWVKQRTRWIKGYMQTYIVHLREPSTLALDFTNPHLVTFHLLMGLKTLFLLANPFLWAMTILYFSLRPLLGGIIESFFPPLILYAGCFVLLIGNFLYIYMYLIALAKKGEWNLIFYVFFIPLYWLLMSYAAMAALGEFIVKPHHWNKTVHGFHLSKLTSQKFLSPT